MCYNSRMELKKCTKCLRELAIECFAEQNMKGKRVRSSHCKECRRAYFAARRADPAAREQMKKYMATYYAERRDAWMAYNRKRLANPAVREQTREWRRKYNKTPQHRAAMSSYYKRNPVKNRARALLNKRVREGVIVPPPSCSKCGIVGKVEGHHHRGYEPPFQLDVVWLCKPCHNAAG
jgi:hypothetical protein